MSKNPKDRSILDEINERFGSEREIPERGFNWGFIVVMLVVALFWGVVFLLVTR